MKFLKKLQIISEYLLEKDVFMIITQALDHSGDDYLSEK